MASGRAGRRGHTALAPGVELCAYRVVQEALTNVLKHAGRAHARVTPGYGQHELTVSVMDDGEGVIQDPP
ncbi:ATP-binding protein [Streptomyces mirabilis]|uniref:ATP-binding protein n=1 Tax=Streptomyces mirabilis TaxID=68239 RepID=UPI0036DFB973